MIFFFLSAIASRIIPHPDGMTAMLAFCFFSASQFSLGRALAISLSTVFLSDLLVSYVYNYPLFGTWMLAVYSAYFFVILLAFFKLSPHKQPIFLVMCASLSFWIWTNFGVWLSTTLYPHTLTGLLTCYWMALPFLKNSLLGDMLWSLLFFYSYRTQLYKTQILVKL